MEINERTFNVIYNDLKQNKSLMTIKNLKTYDQINKEIEKINRSKQNKVTGLIETEHKEKILLLDEYKKFGLLKLNAVYKHFKHTDKDPLNYLYITICTAERINEENIQINNLQSMFSIEYTEIDNKIIDIYYSKEAKKFYYYDEENIIKDTLVIYKSLYDNHITYGRPLNMFMGKVDKEKYPDIKQEYRFELV